VHVTPFLGLGVGTAMLGLNWIIKRRNALATQQPDENRGQGEHRE